MCGIAGLLSPRPEAAEAVGSAIGVMHHRGPDAQRVETNGAAALGFVRLSILDLSDCGMQPMTLPGGRYRLVFNGEIYNYVELRTELQALGRHVRSSGDSEIILHAWEVWGEECVTRFNGMWAFAILDLRDGTLFCSRDRFGVKPFYWAETRLGFAFASEIKALLAMDRSLAEPDNARLYRFLRTGLLDESDDTFFLRVKQLPPAHNMIVAADGTHRVRRYYDVIDAVLEERVDPSESVERFRELMTDAVRLRLRADVPVGTCLSGGLDSSTIVGLADRLMERRVSTFTSVYPGTDSDESAFALVVAERFRTDAHWVEPRRDDFFDIVPDIVWHQDEPTAAAGTYSQWHVMRLAHDNVTVLLDGQGGDEILGGYLGFFADYAAALTREGVRGRPARLAKLAREYGEIRDQLGRDPLLAASMARAPQALKAVYRRRVSHRSLVSTEFADAWSGAERILGAERRLGDPFNDALVDSLLRGSLPSLLHYEDRDSMAFSIEARTPFLDYRLVQFCLAVPFWQKVGGWRTKLLMRDAMADILPPEVLGRRDKKGYPTPLALWLRSGLMPTVREILLSEEARRRGIFDEVQVAALLERHERGDVDAHLEIWRLLNVELWFREFVDGFGVATV